MDGYGRARCIMLISFLINTPFSETITLQTFHTPPSIDTMSPGPQNDLDSTAKPVYLLRHPEIVINVGPFKRIQRKKASFLMSNFRG